MVNIGSEFVKKTEILITHRKQYEQHPPTAVYHVMLMGAKVSECACQSLSGEPKRERYECLINKWDRTGK